MNVGKLSCSQLLLLMEPAVPMTLSPKKNFCIITLQVLQVSQNVIYFDPISQSQSLSNPILFFKDLIYFCWRVRYTEKTKRKVFCPLIRFPRGRNGWS